MRYYLAIFTTIVFFSTIEVVTRHVHNVAPDLDPNLVAFIRFFPAGILMLVLGHRRLHSLTWHDAGVLCLLGFVGITLTFSAYHASLAMKGFDPATGAVIFSVNPVFCSIAAVYILHERLSVHRVVGVILGIAGVYLVSFGFGGIPVRSATAPILMFAAQICFAIYVVAAKRYVARYGPLLVTGVIFVTGSLLFPAMIGKWSFPSDGWTIWWLVYLAFFGTGLAYVLYFYGLNRVPVVAGTSIFFLKPILAPLLAVCVLPNQSNPIRLSFFVGLAVVLAALALAIFGGHGHHHPRPHSPKTE